MRGVGALAAGLALILTTLPAAVARAEVETIPTTAGEDGEIEHQGEGRPAAPVRRERERRAGGARRRPGAEEPPRLTRGDLRGRVHGRQEAGEGAAGRPPGGRQRARLPGRHRHRAPGGSEDPRCHARAGGARQPPADHRRRQAPDRRREGGPAQGQIHHDTIDTGFVAGEHALRINLHNAFPDYDVYIKRIRSVGGPRLPGRPGRGEKWHHRGWGRRLRPAPHDPRLAADGDADPARHPVAALLPRHPGPGQGEPDLPDHLRRRARARSLRSDDRESGDGAGVHRPGAAGRAARHRGRDVARPAGDRERLAPDGGGECDGGGADHRGGADRPARIFHLQLEVELQQRGGPVPAGRAGGVRRSAGGAPPAQDVPAARSGRRLLVGGGHGGAGDGHPAAGRRPRLAGPARLGHRAAHPTRRSPPATRGSRP